MTIFGKPFRAAFVCVSGLVLPLTPSAVRAADATWTATGSNDLVSRADHWGGTLPDLDGGTTTATFVAPAAGGTTELFDRDVSLYGLKFSIPASGKTWNLKGSGTVTVGAGGLTDITTVGRYSCLYAPLVFSADCTIAATGTEQFYICGPFNCSDPANPPTVTKTGSQGLYLQKPATSRSSFTGDFIAAAGYLLLYDTVDPLGRKGTIYLNGSSWMDFSGSGTKANSNAKAITVAADNSVSSDVFKCGTWPTAFTQEGSVVNNRTGYTRILVGRTDADSSAHLTFAGGYVGKGTLLAGPGGRSTAATYVLEFARKPLDLGANAMRIQYNTAPTQAGTVVFSAPSNTVGRLGEDSVGMCWYRVGIRFGCDWAFDAAAMPVYFGNVWPIPVDLAGTEQRIGEFSTKNMTGGAVVTVGNSSAYPAKLHVTETGTAHDQAAVFAGNVTLAKSGSTDFTITNVNTSCGGLEAEGGRIVFSGNGSWKKASHLTIADGASIVTATGGTFGENATLEVTGSGKLSLAGNETVALASCDGTALAAGTYSKSGGSGATACSFLDGTGVLTVRYAAPPTVVTGSLAVPAGTTTFLEDGAAHTHASVDVKGMLEVSGGTTVSVTDLAVTGGLVRLTDAGTTMGEAVATASNATTVRLAPNADGVYGLVAVEGTDAGSTKGFMAKALYVDATNAAVSAERGCVDIAALRGGSLNVRSFYNDSGLEARISVAKADASLYAAGNRDAHPIFNTGAYRIDLYDGVTMTFDAAGQGAYLNAADVSVAVGGEGSVRFSGTQDADYPFTLNAGAVLDNCGEILFQKYTAERNSLFVINDDAVIGPHVTGIRTLSACGDGVTTTVRIAGGVTATLCGDVDLTKNGDCLSGGRLVIDATDAARSFKASVEDGDPLVLEKRGANELVIGVTPNLPTLVVSEGVVRITNDCAITRLVGAAGAKLVADGAVVTLLKDVEGCAFESVNGGSIALAETVYSRHADASTVPEDVHVSSGTLVFSGLGLSKKFWRFTMQRTHGTPQASAVARLFAFGSDGTCVNYEMGAGDASTTAATTPVAEGKIRMVCDPATNIVFASDDVNYRDVKRMTYTSYAGDNYPHLSSPVVDGDNATSAMSFEFQLSAGKAPVTGYTFVANPPAYVTDWTVYASDDGLTWEAVDTRTGETHLGAEGVYATYDGALYDTFLKGKGEPSRAEFERYSLSGYAGSELTSSATAMSIQADGSSTVDLTAFSPAQTVGAITVDVAAGAGTLKGGALASSGVINVVNASGARFSGSLGLTLANVADTSNLRFWTVTVNGEPMEQYQVRYQADATGGHLVIISKGTVIVVK